MSEEKKGMEALNDDALGEVAGGFSYGYEKGKYGEYEYLNLNEAERQKLRKIPGIEFDLFGEDDWNDGEIKGVKLNGEELTPKKIAEILG